MEWETSYQENWASLLEIKPGPPCTTSRIPTFLKDLAILVQINYLRQPFKTLMIAFTFLETILQISLKLQISMHTVNIRFH